MANDQHLQSSTGRNHRRHRALVAHLKACGEWRLSELDQSHPVIASATLAEITAAIAEASRALRCPLENKVERWMNGAAELQVGATPQWRPLREARHDNLSFAQCRSGNSVFVYNEIEVFQVCYRVIMSTKTLVHVQPLTCPEASGYYLVEKAGRTLASAKRLEKPLHPDFTDTRSPFGVIPDTMTRAAMSHTVFSEVPEWELPLFEYIARIL